MRGMHARREVMGRVLGEEVRECVRGVWEEVWMREGEGVEVEAEVEIEGDEESWESSSSSSREDGEREEEEEMGG